MMVDFPKRPKITDPMDVWTSYWQASAEAIVWLVRTPDMIGLDHEQIAKKLKASAMVVGMALALTPSTVDVMSARVLRRQLVAELVEHYLAVAMNLAIEKSRQTGEDFGEYLAVGEQAIRDAIPRWQRGKAPFANFSNVRIKWSFVDHFTNGHWHRASELGEEHVAPEEADHTAVDQLWIAVGKLPRHQALIVNRVFRCGQSPAEVAETLSKNRHDDDKVTAGWVKRESDAALASLKKLFGENVG
jgi:hypothetical protein